MAASHVSAIQLYRSHEVGLLAQRFGAGETLDSLLANPPTHSAVLPVQWDYKDAGVVVELSTQGLTPQTTFLHFVLKLGPNYRRVVAFGQCHVDGQSTQPYFIHWNNGQWVRWSIHFAARNAVSYRAISHDQLAQPRELYTGGGALYNIPAHWELEAVVIGTHDTVQPLSVAEVRVWDGLAMGSLDDQLELLGGQRLDGRETQLIGYWKMNEGEGSRLGDASRFGRHGLNSGGWVVPPACGLVLDDGLERVRQRRETLLEQGHDAHMLKSEVAGRRQQIDLLDDQLRNLQEQRDRIEDRLAALPAEQDRERAELEADFRLWHKRITEDRTVGLNYFSQMLAQEVEQASDELIAAKSAYRLQGVAFEAKMLPVQLADEKDVLVTFPPPKDTTIQPGHLSTLSLAFEPRPPAPARSEQDVPDVVGYTELMARRMLAKAGLQVAVIDQTTDDAAQADRVIDQIPKGGTRTGRELSIHQPVQLFMGRLGG
jgi:hypothetical protein